MKIKMKYTLKNIYNIIIIIVIRLDDGRTNRTAADSLQYNQDQNAVLPLHYYNATCSIENNH